MNRIKGVIAGQYGKVIALSLVDVDGIAVDLTTYTAVVVRALSPDAQTTKQFAGAITSATGGGISFTPDSGTYFTRDGDWEGQVQLSDTGVFSLSVPFVFEVEKQI
jgi:hypothetical protein